MVFVILDIVERTIRDLRMHTMGIGSRYLWPLLEISVSECVVSAAQSAALSFRVKDNSCHRSSITVSPNALHRSSEKRTGMDFSHTPSCL